jgi:hypothetical protein
MGAMITIHCDSDKVTNEQASLLAKNVIELVAEELDDQDVFVYVDSVETQIAAAPIEVVVQVNKHKVSDPTIVLDNVAAGLKTWKGSIGFSLPINLNVIPVEWYSQVGI